MDITGPPPLTPEEEQRASLARSYNGVVTAALKKSAGLKGLNDAGIEEARLAATNAVREALRAPGSLPPPNTDAMIADSCDLRVEGLPLYHDKGQRCCKVGKVKPPPGMARRALEEEEEEDGREAGGGGGRGGREGGALPGVLRTERTGTAEEPEVACLPSFIIAGTQKSGTTALTGEGGGRGL